MNSFQDLNLNKTYTYTDYLTWKFKERVELFRGWVVKMSPAPNTRHQRLVKDILVEINYFLKNKNCEVFPAPFDVRLPVAIKEGKITTVVQPDVVVICDETKLDKQGCNGAPDIVIEVLSPGNTKKEMKDKLFIYQEAVIPEYWLVDPERECIIIYQLNEKGKYIGTPPFTNEDVITSNILVGFEMDLSSLF